MCGVVQADQSVFVKIITIYVLYKFAAQSLILTGNDYAVKMRLKGGEKMDDIISKILQMDETARKLEDEAQAEKIASREEVKKKRQEVYDEYLESAKEHVEQFKIAAKKTSDAEWKKTEKHYDDVSKSLEKKFKDHKDKWVSEIVDGVLSYNT